MWGLQIANAYPVHRDLFGEAYMCWALVWLSCGLDIGIVCGFAAAVAVTAITRCGRLSVAAAMFRDRFDLINIHLHLQGIRQYKISQKHGMPTRNIVQTMTDQVTAKKEKKKKKKPKQVDH